MTKIGICSSDDDIFEQKDFEKKLQSVYENLTLSISRSDITDKTQVIANYDDYNNAIGKRSLILRTSGTTGQGLAFPVDRTFFRAQWTVFRKQFEECGVYGSWRVQFGGRDVKVFGKRFPVSIDYFDKKVIANQYSLDDEQVMRIANICHKKRILWLHGYPSMIYEFLCTWNRLYAVGQLNRKPKNFILTVSSETLTKQLREEFFHLGAKKIFDMYGQTEGIANFFTCKFGRMHVHEDFSLVEFCWNGSSYDIIGTSSQNNHFQFYRYKTGDTVEKVFHERCRCGRNSRTVEGLSGRSEDYLVTKNGLKVGRLDHLTKGDDRIKRAQIIQNSFGTADFIIQCDPCEASDVLANIKKRCRNYFGDDVQFNFILSDEFKLKANGKFTFVLNNLDSKH